MNKMINIIAEGSFTKEALGYSFSFTLLPIGSLFFPRVNAECYNPKRALEDFGQQIEKLGKAMQEVDMEWFKERLDIDCGRVDFHFYLDDQENVMAGWNIISDIDILEGEK